MFNKVSGAATLQTVSDNKDLKRLWTLSVRLLVTLLVVVTYSFMIGMSLPGVTPLKELYGNYLGLSQMLNVFGINGITQQSIVAIGIAPYVTAQIFVQILQKGVSTHLTDLTKMGHLGKKRLSQLTHYVGMVLAILFASFMAFAGTDSLPLKLELFGVLMAGYCILIWFTTMINRFGLGNGSAIIMIVGILAGYVNLIQESKITSKDMSFLLYCVLFMLVGLFIVAEFQMLEKHYRIVLAKQRIDLVDKAVLPFKVSLTGVMPIIFAGMLFTLIQMILQFVSSTFSVVIPSVLIDQYLGMQTWESIALYLVVVFLGTFLYSFIQMNVPDLQDNLEKQSTYIAGIALGDDTARYIRGQILRLDVSGALIVTLIAGVPLILVKYFALPSALGYIGSNLFIIVIGYQDIYRHLTGIINKKITKST
ncbi:hypothetical protein KAR63_08135 [Weissella uvarum]|nr:hypothetical protein [Weissella uvarum]